MAQPGFAVYRNTVLKGCIDALQANYPTVARLVGDEWFRAAAGRYVRAHAAVRDRACRRTGEGLPTSSSDFEPAASCPTSRDVARRRPRLDRGPCRRRRDRADSGRARRVVARTAWLDATLLPHPATRWAWCDELPIYTFWSRHREHVADSAARRRLARRGRVC